MENSLQSTQNFIGKLQELLTDSDNDIGQFCFQEEMIEKVVQDFYKEIAKSPSPMPMPFPSLSLPNAKDGSFGTSIAVSASKLEMMAGAEAVSSAVKVGMQGKENGSLVVELQGGSEEFVGFEVVGEEKKMKQGLRCEDAGEFDDGWMARVNSCVQVVNGFDFNQE